jgi:nucleotide-binding universal stress UspA family protein
LLFEEVLFNSGRPIITVPYIHNNGANLERALVCWDGSRTAGRAVADALPLLARANQVDIVTVVGSNAARGTVSGADIGRHLARHGLKAEVHQIYASDIDVTSALLSFAADRDSQLIVMGGYGHSRLREFVLGGATQGLLHSMTVPTLMAH